MGIQSRPGVGAKARITTGNQSEPNLPCLANELDQRFDFTSESLSFEETTLESESIRDGRGRAPTTRGARSPEGDLNGEFMPELHARLIRHSLGDALRMNEIDGAQRGRLSVDYANTSTFVLFVADYVHDFPIDGGEVGLVYRDRSVLNTLKYENNSDNYFDYDEFRPALSTYLAESKTIDVETTPDTIEIRKGMNGEVFNTLNAADIGDGFTGTFRVEIDGAVYILTYDNIDATDPDNFVANIVSITGPGGTSLDTLAVTVGKPAYSTASMFGEDPIFAGFDDADLGTDLENTVPSGAFVYGRWNNVDVRDNLWAHHIEIGDDLPPGLTVEVVRDAVNFLYVGMMVNTASFTFDSQALANCTYSLIGVEEFSVVALAREAAPGDSVIYVDEEPIAFNYTSGYLTIGQEARIRHGAVSYNPTLDLWEIAITGTAEEAIQRSHKIGSNVDSSVTRSEVNPLIPEIPRFAWFEGHVTKDTDEIEVLNASLTIENNLGTDKFMLGKISRAAIREARCEVSGTLNVEFDDGRHYKDFLKGNSFSVDLRWISDDPNYTVEDNIVYPISTTFFCPRVRLEGETPTIDDDSYITHDLNFMAEDDGRFSVRNPALVVTVTNRSETDSL